jgi:hypothetical protein
VYAYCFVHIYNNLVPLLVTITILLCIPTVWFISLIVPTVWFISRTISWLLIFCTSIYVGLCVAYVVYAYLLVSVILLSVRCSKFVCGLFELEYCSWIYSQKRAVKKPLWFQ